MPRLNYSKITKGDAVSALIRIYRQQPLFMKELTKIREPYQDTIKKFTFDSIAYFLENGISPSDYYQSAVNYVSGKNEQDPFPSEKLGYISQLQPYYDSLNELAYKWKLRAVWAVVALFGFDMIDVLLKEGLPDELDMPMEVLGEILPWSPKLPPLEIKIHSWAVITMGREKILSEIADRIKQYELELKKAGLAEYPSSLENHARWWFEHYINGKKYDEIAQMETETPGGSLISYAKNIGIAVRKFSRLIGVNTKG
jgi:hypothetical protein